MLALAPPACGCMACTAQPQGLGAAYCRCSTGCAGGCPPVQCEAGSTNSECESEAEA